MGWIDVLFGREDKYVKKLEQGIVFYRKPKTNNFSKEIKQIELKRKLETKRVTTHTRK